MRDKLILSVAAAAFSCMVAFPVLAQEGDCKTGFPMQSSTGEVTALTLFNFGKHLELQADTPKQETLSNVALVIDGEPAELFSSPGLDDLLIGFSTSASELEVSDAMLSKLAKGREAVLSASTLEGKPVRAAFKLDSAVSNISHVMAGCKAG